MRQLRFEHRLDILALLLQLTMHLLSPEHSVDSGDWTQSAFAVKKTQGTAFPSSHVAASSFVLGLPRAEDDQAHHPVPSLGAAEKALQD